MESVHIQVIKNIPVLRLTNIVVITTDNIFELFVTCYSSADTMLPCSSVIMLLHRTRCPKHDFTIMHRTVHYLAFYPCRSLGITNSAGMLL